MALAIDRAREFLQLRRLALVGISRQERDFSRMLLRELVGRGVDVVPVSPAMAEVDSRRCFARVQEVHPPVDGAILLTAPAVTEQVVHDCLEAGIRRVWMHRGAGPGSASPGAVAFCRANGIEVITDLCPMMVATGAAFPHRLHGFFRRRFGHERIVAAPR